MIRQYAAYTLPAAPPPPAVPATGYPQSGGVSTPPTQLGAYWYHMVTETLLHPVVAAGLTPAAADMSQLTLAIEALALAAVPPATPAEITAGSNVLHYINPAQLIAAAVAAATAVAMPVGMLGHRAGSTAPPGWLIADGSAVSRATYAALWAHAQASGMMAADAADHAANPTKYYVGDGVATFNVPDLRGVFLRGLDAGRGLDGGRGLGTYQDSANLAHTHNSRGSGPGGTLVGISATDSDNDLTDPTSSSGGAESRPRNAAVLTLIKC